MACVPSPGTVDGCDGRCCAVFNYSVSLDELKSRDDAESAFLADMFVPLTREEALDRIERFNIATPEGYSRETWMQHQAYTCRHWDEETRLCGVYEDRPRMCRDYPYEYKCCHGCECYAEEDIIAKYRGYREEREERERMAENSNPSPVKDQCA